MANKAITRSTIRYNTIRDMKKLGTYKPEFDPLIDIYAELCEQYIIFTKQFKEDKYKCAELTAAGGTKKSALVGTLETLRKDILMYSDRLCLNPKSLSSSSEDKSKSNTETESILIKALMNRRD